MSEEPNPFEIRILPDWLKETAPDNRYAHYEGGDDRGGERGRGRSDRRGGDSDRRGPRPGQARKPDPARRPPAGAPGPKRTDAAPGGGGPRPQVGGAPQGDRRQGDRRPDRDSRSDPRRDQRPPRPEPANVRIDYLPESHALDAVGRELRAGHLTHPLFDLARLFLQKPERYNLVIECSPDAPEMLQAGEGGPIGLTEADIERDALRYWHATYFTQEEQDVEPPKGNITRVARCTLSGVLLGPPNHHEYQPALRGLYEARFSRRMDFEEYRRKIELTDDAEAIEKWKTQVSRKVIYKTTDAENPITFDSQSAAEAHFRTQILPGLLRTGRKLLLNGRAARSSSSPSLVEAMRLSMESEQRFPARMGRSLQHLLLRHGLHFFKHRKKIVCLSPYRPNRFPFGDISTAPGLERIVRTVLEQDYCTRKSLAEALIPAAPAAPEAPRSAEPAAEVTSTAAADVPAANSAPAAESAPPAATDPRVEEQIYKHQEALRKLAADLHFLVSAGHLLEFPDGRIDAAYPPQPPGTEEQPPSKPAPKHVSESVTEPAPPREPTPAEEQTHAGQSVQPEHSEAPTATGHSPADSTPPPSAPGAAEVSSESIPPDHSTDTRTPGQSEERTLVELGSSQNDTESGIQPEQ